MSRALALLCCGLILAACTSPAVEQAREPTPAPSPDPSPTATPAPTPLPEDPFALARVYEFPDPDSLAQELPRLEAMLRSGDADPLEVGRPQQAAYRQLASRPDWREQFFARFTDGGLTEVFRANTDAQAELFVLTDPREALPPWRIVPPRPAAELRRFYAEAEAEFGVPWAYLAAIHLVETRMGRIRGTSHAGAQGPMQFLPSTWAAYGRGDINDDRDAIFAAARYLVASGAPERMDDALYAYNHSRRYVRAVGLYAQRMLADEVAFAAYHQWQVYYRTVNGDALLPEGWVRAPA